MSWFIQPLELVDDEWVTDELVVAQVAPGTLIVHVEPFERSLRELFERARALPDGRFLLPWSREHLEWCLRDGLFPLGLIAVPA